MANSISYYAHKISDQAYHLIYGYELSATPKNLQWALKQNKDEILKYRFQDTFRTYSILEFSIKCHDEQAVANLIELGTDLEFSEANGGGTMLHFYMDCLEENTVPNLKILKLLLDNISDINVEDSGYYFQTALERALSHMAHYKKIHWEVIETLIEQGIRIKENVFTQATPFTILKDSDRRKIQYKQMLRTFDEEIVFLDKLVRYLEIEKKYHPDSNSGLSLDDFKFHTSNLQAIFIHAAIFMDSSSFMVKAADSLSNDLMNSNLFSEQESNELMQEIASYKKETSQELFDNSNKIVSAFVVYHKYFQALVTNGTFKECFADWELAAISAAVKKGNGFAFFFLEMMFRLWGLN